MKVRGRRTRTSRTFFPSPLKATVQTLSTISTSRSGSAAALLFTPVSTTSIPVRGHALAISHQHPQSTRMITSTIPAALI